MYRKMDLQKALSYAQRSIALDPSFVKAHDQLGLCYAGMGDNENAIQSYKTAILLNDKQSLRSPWPALNLGTLYFRLDRLPEAENALSQSLAAEPKFPAAHFRLGQVLEKEGQTERAIQELQKSAELDPTYPEPHYALARIYRMQSNVNAAERELSLFAKLREIDNQKGIVRPD
jgi:tetratricopeptide (TPR) repeat protein